jgi:hypothetical protein
MKGAVSYGQRALIQEDKLEPVCVQCTSRAHQGRAHKSIGVDPMIGI